MKNKWEFKIGELWYFVFFIFYVKIYWVYVKMKKIYNRLVVLLFCSNEMLWKYNVKCIFENGGSVLFL